MPYGTIFLILVCMTFFAEAAVAVGRSRTVGAMASLGAWIVFTSLIWGGTIGGLVSQVLLFAGWGASGALRDAWAERRRG